MNRDKPIAHYKRAGVYAENNAGLLLQRRISLNKNTKIWLNYLLGAAISVLLLWGIYLQAKKQLHSVDGNIWQQTGPAWLLWLAILLYPINAALEAKKWHILAGSAQRTTYRQAFTSYLAGIAFSVVTPNRLGEYPGRILYLRRERTFRLISVSILGAFAQLITVFIFGMGGLIYYNLAFPDTPALIALLCCIAFILLLGIIYLRFEKWLPALRRFKWVKRMHVYRQLLIRFKNDEQFIILAISMLRFVVFTAQYLILLRWMNVSFPLREGFFIACLFFWAITVIPSIALAELGIRSQVGVFLFGKFSANTMGIVGATAGLWLINLVLPAVVGSILLIRLRLWK